MPTATDLALLLRAVLDDPADDSVRLAYADALEEAGDLARSEFIRVQVALDPLRCWGNGTLGEPLNDAEVAELRRYNTLRRRERALFAAHGAAWFGPTGCLTPPNERERQSGGEFRVVRRGFVARGALPAAAWLAHADQILAAHPVTEVVLTSLPEVRYSLPLRPASDTRLCKLDGRPSVPVGLPRGKAADRASVARALLAAYWPRIAFTLPA